MNEDYKIVTVIVSGLVIVLLALIFVLNFSYNQRVLSAFKNGYEEATIPGHAGTVWKKADKQ